MKIQIDNKIIAKDKPVYFIADIAANHDGDLERAKELIYLAAEAGADAAKFQHFTADTIVSDYGFKSLGSQLSHQSKWNKSVYDVYKDASLNVEWTSVLKNTCDKAGISFFTSPYSFELVDKVDPYVPAYKIGSGDITWTDIIEYMAAKGKPVLLACGAATHDEVVTAVNSATKFTDQVILMQCNTNYTASVENFKYINLNVLKTFSLLFPDLILGLSDHTSGHTTVLGAVALGARVVEKHFTDDTSRPGPDHGFSMDPVTWKTMVNFTRELELSLGSSIKTVEENEKDTIVLQRRSIRAKYPLVEGSQLTKDCLEVLRPCPKDALPPYQMNNILGKKITKKIEKGNYIRWIDLA